MNSSGIDRTSRRPTTQRSDCRTRRCELSGSHCVPWLVAAYLPSSASYRLRHFSPSSQFTTTLPRTKPVLSSVDHCMYSFLAPSALWVVSRPQRGQGMRRSHFRTEARRDARLHRSFFDAIARAPATRDS